MVRPAMPTLERDDGVRLHVETGGVPGAPTLLLLHGWSRSGEDLAPLAARLRAAGHQTVVPDLRGHGRSSDGPLDLDRLAADLTAVATAFAPPGAVLLAWSLGALAALRALAASPALAGRLRGAVLIGATPRFTEGEAWPHGQPARVVEGLALRLRRAPQKALARFLDDCLAPGEAEALPPGALSALRAGPAPSLPAALAGLEVLATADLRADLRAGGPGLALPVLLIHGEADAICPAGAGRALSALLPRARLALLPGGHAPFLAREAEVAGLVADFAREVA